MENENLFEGLALQLARFESESDLIPENRKPLLEKIAMYVGQRFNNNTSADLIFICTHNSRRSHMAQHWAQAAAWYYGLEHVHCFSGGTEATVFHPNAIKALTDLGFEIVKESGDNNPIYLVRLGASRVLKAFSKTFDHQSNPRQNFAAIMTCSHADKNCPLVVGCDLRVATPYDDPKHADHTPAHEKAYLKAAEQIGREMTYAMHLAKKQVS